MRNKLYWSTVVFLFFAGCNLSPPYRVPETEVPEQWKFTESNNIETQEAVDNWWEIFHDETLNHLEMLALENSKDLEETLQKIFEARAAAGLSESNLFPQLSLNPAYSNTATLIKVFGLPQTVPPLPTILRIHNLLYSLPLNLSYELDLWGKYRNQYKSSLLTVEARQMELESTLLILTSDIASNYFQLRSYDAQLDLLKRTFEVRQDAMKLNEVRYRAGLINFTDVTRAETLMYRAESEYFDTKRLRTLKENLIASLIGIPPTDLSIAPNPLLEPPPLIPAGIPSDILLRRPDIKQLERETASDQVLIGSARANFFPTLNLTGTFGFASPDLGDFLKWKSRLWTLGANSSEPIFDGWRNLSNLQYSWARFRKSSATYQKKVITAFEEVENALVNLKYQAEQMISLENAVDSVKLTTKLSKIRYFKGLDNYLEVVDSERTELETQRNLLELLGKRYISTIQLIKALGGCWDSDNGCTEVSENFPKLN